MQLNPGWSKPWYRAGCALLHLHKYNQAATVFNEALRLLLLLPADGGHSSGDVAAVQQQLGKVHAAVAAERQQQGVRRLLLQQHMGWAHNKGMEVSRGAFSPCEP